MAIFLAGVAVNFFIFGSLGIISFTDYRNVLLIPSVVAIAIIAVYSHFRMRHLSNRSWPGLWIGIVVTVALEAI